MSHAPLSHPLPRPHAVACAVCALLLSTPPGTAIAQAEDAPDGVMRVEITANKRRERQRDVASTVSVLQGDALEAAGARDMDDVFRLTPGVQANKGDPDQSVPTIRGVGTVLGASGFGLQQATTGVYVDDVPCTDPVGYIATCDLAPFDLERVEVLRGPQGVLFGSASLGGAVRYLLKKPSAAATEFSLLASAGAVAHGGIDRSLHAMLNLPLGRGGLRAVLFDRRDSGTVHNTGTRTERADALHQRGGRVLGSAPLGERAKASVLLMTQRTDIDDTHAVDDPARREVATPSPSSRRSEVNLANLQLEADLGAVLLNSNSGLLDKHVRARPDQTRRTGDLGALLGLPALPLVLGRTDFDSRATSQELRLSSNTGGPVSWLVGAFYQRTRFDGEATLTAPGGAALWGEDLLPGDRYYRETDRSLATERALFADGEWRFAGGWTAALGARWYRNSLHFDADSRLLEPLLGALVVSHRKTENGVTPRASLKYAFGEHLWYATLSRGYRFGGVNPGSGTTYESDSLWNHETGVRLQLAPGLALDASLFRLDWRDAQVNARQPGEVPVNGIANVGRARIDGLELLARWRLHPGSLLTGSLAYTDARTRTAFTSNNGSVVPAGTRLPGTPRWQSALQFSQQFDGPWRSAGRWEATHSFIGARSLSLDAGGQAAAYALWDTRLAFAREGWELALFVHNLADKRGVAGGAPVATFGGSSYTEYTLTRPRTVGLSLRHDL